MAKIFLDANVFINVVEKRKTPQRQLFLNHTLFISPLSIHILTYLYKYKIPDNRLKGPNGFFHLVPFNEEITGNALTGPTVDFEDNVQLHSAAEAECEIFLTEDKKLLQLGFFGKTHVVSQVSQLQTFWRG